MKLIKYIKSKAAIGAVVFSTVMGAFFMSPVMAFASDGGGAAVYVEEPRGWQTKAVTMQVKTNDGAIYDDKGKEIPVHSKCVYASIDDAGFEDITASMVVTIDHNCKLNLKAIYEDGSTVYNYYTFTNFDLEIPTVKAYMDGELMYITAADEISGVKSITVNNKAFTELGNGTMCVNVKDLESTDEYFQIYSNDVAGNKSKEFKVKNPYYVGEIESGQQDQSLDNPDSVEATDPTEARGTVTEDVTTTKDGEVIKEFYTVDASGKTFYIIVDKSQNSDNVYLLTEAGVNDLLNFVDYNGVDVQNGDVPMYEVPSSKREIVVDEDVETTDEEPVKEEKTETKSNSSAMFIIVILIAGVGVGYYFYKNKKRKEDLEEAEEMDAYDVPDEDESEVLVEEGDEDDYEDYEDEESDDDVEDITEEDIEGAEIMPEDLIEADSDFEVIHFGDEEE